MTVAPIAIPLWADLGAVAIASMQGAIFAAKVDDHRIDLLGVGVVGTATGLGDGGGETGAETTDLGGEHLPGVDARQRPIHRIQEREDQEQTQHDGRRRTRPQADHQEDDGDDPLLRDREHPATGLVDQRTRDGNPDRDIDSPTPPVSPPLRRYFFSTSSANVAIAK